METVERCGRHKIAILPVAHAVHGLEHRLRTECGVAALYVFGSVARGEARADSDIDVLVEFDGPPTFAFRGPQGAAGRHLGRAC
jgi:hypothetical protein